MLSALISGMEALQQAKGLSFDEVWKLVEDVRSDPECMRVLRRLSKSYTS